MNQAPTPDVGVRFIETKIVASGFMPDEFENNLSYCEVKATLKGTHYRSFLHQQADTLRFLIYCILVWTENHFLLRSSILPESSKAVRALLMASRSLFSPFLTAIP